MNTHRNLRAKILHIKRAYKLSYCISHLSYLHLALRIVSLLLLQYPTIFRQFVLTIVEPFRLKLEEEILMKFTHFHVYNLLFVCSQNIRSTWRNLLFFWQQIYVDKELYSHLKIDYIETLGARNLCIEIKDYQH